GPGVEGSGEGDRALVLSLPDGGWGLVSCAPAVRAPSALRATPPFRCRSTGEKSWGRPDGGWGLVSCAPAVRAPSALRATPPFRCRSTGGEVLATKRAGEGNRTLVPSLGSSCL